MKKYFVMMALTLGMGAVNAQEVTNEQNAAQVQTVEAAEQPQEVSLCKEIYPQAEQYGDLYHGLTRKLSFDRMIPPHGLEVTYDKTVHVIFPAAVRYVDLGSPNLIAGKADGAENVIRVKATVRDFRAETNMSVITEDGSFYTFNVRYASEPLLLNVEMHDFIHDGSTVNRPNNAMEVYLTELGSESPLLVRLIMKSIYKQDKREVKHIGCKRFGVQYLLKGIYTHNGLLYFHTQIKNGSNVPFDVDFITFKIVDKKVAKRTAMQEQVIFPLRAYNYATRVAGKKDERTVFTMEKFTIPDDKCLVVELNEKNGGRHQSFIVENEDLVRANVINELKGYYVGAAMATYTKGGNKWVFGGEYLQRYNSYKEVRIPTAQFTAEGGFYYNFLSDARKIFFLYLGGSALAGYETVNWGDKELFDGSRLTDKDAFIYGGAVSLEAEAYLADRIALVVNIRERCLWGGSTGRFHTQYGIGLKFIIN